MFHLNRLYHGAMVLSVWGRCLLTILKEKQYNVACHPIGISSISISNILDAV